MNIDDRLRCLLQLFVINLPEDDVRRLAAKRQLEGLGVAYQFFRAVDGKTASQQFAAEENTAMLVLEDDFTLQNGFREAITEVEMLILEYGFIRLQTDLRAKKAAIRNCGRFRLSRYTKAPHATLCYAISPAVARCFLEKTAVIDAPVDVFIKKFWEHEQPLYALTPYTVVTSELALDTTIVGRCKPRKPFRLALLRFLTKCDWHAQRFIYNIGSRFGES